MVVARLRPRLLWTHDPTGFPAVVNPLSLPVLPSLPPVAPRVLIDPWQVSSRRPVKNLYFWVEANSRD